MICRHLETYEDKLDGKGWRCELCGEALSQERMMQLLRAKSIVKEMLSREQDRALRREGKPPRIPFCREAKKRRPGEAA